jgi:hypothetical protein
MQIGLGPSTLKKLQSCLVAAEAACSSGDLPVAAVEARLAAVAGLATAAEATVVPADPAAVVAEPPRAMRGAAQPVKLKQRAEPPKVTVT